ncbi:ATP-binding protein [Phenylobacterium sp.]|uniref:hybrid sensor histidine kinase/response regulator n=1 Tax=Phenylobacterium sp. TaxID=1871053 RepID=UPI0035B1FF82
MARDIDRRDVVEADGRTNAELAETIEHLKRAQRLSNTGSWDWNVGTDEIIWSDQIFQIFGLDAASFQPSYPAFIERVHPADRARVEAAVRRALDGEQAFELDHRIVRPDGSVRVVHEEGEVVRSPDGAVLRMVGAVQDVTQLRSAEAASRRSQEMLESMLRISPEAIVVTDPTGRILLFSAGAEATFGYLAEEVVGLRVEALMPERLRFNHSRHVEGFAEGVRPSLRMHERAEIMGLRKSGDEFPAEASLARLETGDGFVFTAIIRDLSDSKAAERRLIEAREEAERASLAKSSFLANMSHEIRTPLNGVLGVAGALARTGLNAKQAEMVNLIEASGRALEGLLSDILDLAKVDAGRMAIRAEPFDLCAVVRDTVALFQASAAEKGVGLSLVAEPATHCYFLGDDLRIRQVLSNLLSNAVKFTARGQVRMRVTDRGESAGVRRIRFAVEDTGIGFAPETAGCLFERFEQADGSITRRFGGTGLGLAICKSLVELMGGTIAASSQPGVGSVFTVELPLPMLDSVSHTGGTCAFVQTEVSPNRLQVLLAEDHVINRRAVELILEPLPIDLTCVENGREAVAAASKRAFDLILMDMQMPVMDGLSAIELIRAREAEIGARRAPICVLTANAMPEHRAAAERAGADAFLTKPIHAEALIEMVAELADAPYRAAEGVV